MELTSRYSTKKPSGDRMNNVENKYAYCIAVVKFFEMFTYLDWK